ncbi:MAG: hypothetical protein M1833_002106 [Piccolia ochrophora]|nr:MAG: hypothetical protein M1833_002106 [Piccolia ochrophora]
MARRTTNKAALTAAAGVVALSLALTSRNGSLSVAHLRAVCATYLPSGITRGGVARVVALLFLVANLKCLPGMWHFRIFSSLFMHLRVHAPSDHTHTPRRALFRPVITPSHVPLLDCDWYGHKSNSTYFADLDVSRSHLVAALFKAGIREPGPPPAALVATTADGAGGTAGEGRRGGGGDKPSVQLGGVSCVFRREIRPYQRYEVWSRVCAWDRKWLYIVSHFVEPGKMRAPKKYLLQNGRQKKTTPRSTDEESVTEKKSANGVPPPPGLTGPSSDPAPTHPALFASAISRYVFKRGRLTVPPETVLERCELLPPRPSPSPATEAQQPRAPSDTETPHDPLVVPEAHDGHAVRKEEEEEEDAEDADWTWDRVEAERRRGMALAGHLAGMEALHGELEREGEAEEALGRYWDVVL